MSDPRTPLDDRRNSPCEGRPEGPGLAPLLLGGLLTGLAGVASALLGGAGWWVALAAYWGAGTAGALLAAALAAGLVRRPRWTPPRPRRTPPGLAYALAAPVARRARR